MMSKFCAVCEKELAPLDFRKIANNELLCMDCLHKAKTLSLRQQTFGLKSLSSDDIKDSIIKSGGSVKSHNSVKKSAASTFEVLEDPKNPAIKCTNCSSMDIQFMQNDKKAFSAGKAVGGAVLTGGVGVLAGFAGKKGDDQWRCNNCGHIFSTARKK